MALGRRRASLPDDRGHLPLRRAVIIGVVAAVASATALAVVTVDSGRRTIVRSAAVPSPRRLRLHGRHPATSTHTALTSAVSSAPAGPVEPLRRRVAAVRPSYAVGVVRVRMVDPSRRIRTASGAVRRSFDTVVRYPIGGAAAPPAGPFPLIVFGHGFAVSPQPYALLLDAWTRAGYVVAAPVFPLENADAPGGPDERDLPNQPGDTSLVISSLTAASAQSSGPLAGMINPRQIAVTGQSDGGDTALAVAYDPVVRDPRIGAAMILSGAEDPFAAPFTMASRGPALLAVQGTADTINPPSDTSLFYAEAAPPKFLLRLLGAGHQAPYTEPGADLAAVEHTTIAFLDAFFRDRRGPLRRLLAVGSAGPGTAFGGVGG